ncbi:TIGR03087 family PEP-CTERM/XrtA system glycosyltransferase [Novosphingobium sp. P6W]|uniref:TIGR03087 family PEP-CTERM/XrtA system glycosyltransferase n=1 Tax=Novosphingobium sp. P6W TaxID=1609758 RepID=UPI0005C31AE3|nr:TIGR03087 family PEP-CTERM/XrtA system glycosyltransferase [Novosphingobium sp. P6W]AXB76943.1 TIGR03087 family PEP-CTERM/XrtA system glycosyltransferase [Novosphingobium sp. P6W]KIS33217.1 glycosyl transferase family 1 [Novosphingobium sp. P6W]
MGEILFLSHRIPFPPDRGDKIRSHHILKALAALAPVHVATFADDEQDCAYEADLADLAASYRLVERKKALPVAGVEAMASRRPLSLSAFHDRKLETYVRDLLAQRPIDVIYVFSGQMAQYVPEGFAGRVIADLVDVDSAKFEAYAAKGRGFRSWMEKREARLLRAEEARIAAAADVTLLISGAEAELLRSRLPDGSARAAARVRAMGNGLDADYFDPAAALPEPRMLAHEGPRIVFTGQMDYAPNIEAATRAIERIMPLVREMCPGASLHIVGRNPTPALAARSGRDGIMVWGRVDDIRPWLAAADMALVPLEIARGVQNKVLEAMAMALPVVLSPGAATGIDALDGKEFAVRESDAAIAQALLDLGRAPALAREMGQAARDWILANASWEAALARLPEYMGVMTESTIDAA